MLLDERFFCIELNWTEAFLIRTFCTAWEKSGRLERKVSNKNLLSISKTSSTPGLASGRSCWVSSSTCPRESVDTARGRKRTCSRCKPSEARTANSLISAGWLLWAELERKSPDKGKSSERLSTKKCFYGSSRNLSMLTFAVPNIRKTDARRFKLKITISPMRITITSETI